MKFCGTTDLTDTPCGSTATFLLNHHPGCLLHRNDDDEERGMSDELCDGTANLSNQILAITANVDLVP